MNYEIVTLILGGGEGSRLFPLTQYRAKPAVPISERCTIVNKERVEKADGKFYHIRYGIVIIPKHAVVPPGTTI